MKICFLVLSVYFEEVSLLLLHPRHDVLQRSVQDYYLSFEGSDRNGFGLGFVCLVALGNLVLSLIALRRFEIRLLILNKNDFSKI